MIRRTTFKQLETLAKATRTPIGFLFLPEPPVERLPIRDLRTASGIPLRPSADLLDTIYMMQRRQDWLREDRAECEASPLDVVGSARLDDEPEAVGQEMRRVVGVGEGWAAEAARWEEAVGVIRAALEGRLSFKEAYDLTGLRGGAFQEYARRLGVSLP